MNNEHPLPVNRVAARVIKRGERYEPDMQIGCQEFDVRPAGVPLPAVYKNNGVSWEKPPKNLIGYKIGRMTVVDYAGKSRPKSITGKKKSGQDAQKWICRCPCGRYTIRKGNTILAAKDPDDKCEHCRHLAFLKYGTSSVC